jgi:hypothetical protein
MKNFTFTGTSTIKRKFSIQISATNYEQAQEKAFNLLDDVDDSEYYTIGDDQVEVEIDSYEEEVIVGNQSDRYEFEDCA